MSVRKITPYLDGKIVKISFLCIFCILTTVINFGIITTILVNGKLRNSSKHWLVVVLCMCDLITGLFVYTLYADFLVEEVWDHDCHTYIAFAYYYPTFLCTFRMSLMIALFIDFFLSLMIKNAKLLKGITASMVTCAFVSSLVLIIPIIKHYQKECDLSVDLYQLNVATFFPQMVVLVFLGVTIAVVFLKHHREFPLFDPLKPTVFPKDIFLACIVMIWFTFPYQVFLISPHCGYTDDCKVNINVLFDCLRFFSFAQTFVLPLMWCTNKELFELFCCCRTFRGREIMLPGKVQRNNQREITRAGIRWSALAVQLPKNET